MLDVSAMPFVIVPRIYSWGNISPNLPTKQTPTARSNFLVRFCIISSLHDSMSDFVNLINGQRLLNNAATNWWFKFEGEVKSHSPRPFVVINQEP